MASASSARLLARLEAALEAFAVDRDAAVLAFSGGLASLVLAALLRKRVDLDCVVVGVKDAPDLVAARRASDFLDYRVREVRLSVMQAVALARRVARSHPVPTRSAFALAPVLAVAAANRGRPVVAGCGWRAEGADASLAVGTVDLPWRAVTLGRGVPRTRIQAVARVIGLPESFVRVRALTPGTGMGLEPALRTAARDRGVSLRELLANR